MKKLAMVFAAMLLMGGVTVADGPSWTFVDLGITVGDGSEDFFGGDTDGLSVAGSWGKGMFHIGGNYGQLNFIDADFDIWELSAGINKGITDNTDMYFDVFYEDWDEEDIGITADRTGIAWGIRSMMTDDFELSGGMTYNEFSINPGGFTLEADDVGFNFGMQYFVTDSLGLGFQYERFDFVYTDDFGTVDTARFYLRYSFGRK